jgi:pimeloyl-ACP methyl ester carboxylesterase
MLGSKWPPRPDGAFATTRFLLLTGENDMLMPASEVIALAGRYPLAEAVSLPGAGHADGLRAAPDYAPTVLGFLDRALGRRTEATEPATASVMEPATGVT